MTEKQIGLSTHRKQEVDQLIQSGDFPQAKARLVQIWAEKPGPASAGFVTARLDKLPSSMFHTSYRIAILRSFTVEPIVPILRAAAGLNGIDLLTHIGNFNTYAQDILDPKSALYLFGADIVFLIVLTRDVAPELWTGFSDLSKEHSAATISRVVGHFRDLIEAFRSRSKAHVILHTLEAPPVRCQGILDDQIEYNQVETIYTINSEIRRLARNFSGVYVLDYDALVARYGRDHWHDERKWLTMRMPIVVDGLIHVANEWLRFIHPLCGRVCKALVVDLDNTLWGGILGEDGFSGLKLGPEYPGAAYQALQRAMLDLYQRGVILAICSKNNPADALEVIAQHSGMMLRSPHFAAVRINWNDKAQNLREIAAELNIGIDSLAFLDDNPVEREWVRSQLPEVTVIELPHDPMGYASTLRNSPFFERLVLLEEDRERGRYYAEERMRKELQHTVPSLADFYRSLTMEAEISPVTPPTLSRVAQLTQKTNQFNLTTRRYSEQQVADMADDPNWLLYTIAVHDRFGDNGLVGIAMGHIFDGVCEVDTFLMSCRVIGRGIETALLAKLSAEARAKGAQRLTGWYLATKKNDLAKSFYETHGFNRVGEREGSSRWEFNLARGQIGFPPWIKLNPK